ncbi:uncharacterized protein [Dermacentor andersoni]|uniref:uncharacterized protein n=1 Tax=Dermacentor andersoni TaxID=34620 RepID=UPI003B3AAEDC
MDLEKITAIGLQIGLSGAELRRWIEAEQAKQRDERAAEREAAKEAAELARLADERQREILQLKLQLQEGARNVPAAASEILTAPSTSSSSLNPQKLLPLFDEKRDDLHAYIQRFERIATGQDWPQEKWALALSMCLTGEALTVIGRMTATDSLDYPKVKKALLQRFQFTAQGYQEKFRKARAVEGETGRQLAARISAYFDHWIEMANVPKTYEGLRDNMISEQFLRCCEPKLVIFLKEREGKSLDELASLTDRFLEAQNWTNLGKGPDNTKDSGGKNIEAPRKPQLMCTLCHRFGHLAPDCRAPPKRMLKCELCDRTGHTAENCRTRYGDNKPSSACAFTESRQVRTRPVKESKHPGKKTRQSSDSEDKNPGTAVTFLIDGMPVVEGRLLGRSVRVLRDTGCNTAIVKRELVPEMYMTGRTNNVVLLDGSTSYLPEAVVQVNTPYFSGKLTVTCMDEPLYDLVLGNLPGVRGPYDPDSDWKPPDAPNEESSSIGMKRNKAPRKHYHVSSVAEAKIEQAQGKIRPLCVPTIVLRDVTKDQLIEEQRKDPTLKHSFAKVSKSFNSGKGHSYEFVEKEVQEMLKMGVVERSKSPYHAPIVVVKKPDNTIRLCVDFRELNKILIPDCEPIPRIDVVLAFVGQKKFFSKFDFTKGYWQVPMSTESREKTAFSSTSGLYHFIYMPFGIKTAPAVFARLMRSVLGGLANVHHYFDDVVVATDTWQEHIDTLRQVFEKIKQANLTIKPSKCEIGESSITFLGHRIGKSKVEPLLKTLDKILATKRPTNKKAVQSFLGLTGYYRKFIPNYAELTKPLTDLTKKGQSSTVVWGPTQEEAFTTLKSKLSEAPILLAPNLSKEFVLRTDASNTSLGAVLLQIGDDQRLCNEDKVSHKNDLEECAIWWVSKCDSVYQGLVNIISSDPILTLPDFKLTFELKTEASYYSTGTVLYQRDKEAAQRQQQKVVGLGEHLKNADALSTYAATPDQENISATLLWETIEEFGFQDGSSPGDNGASNLRTLS